MTGFAQPDPAQSARRCAACGGRRLSAHLKVAGGAGARGLIPSTTAFGVALSDIVRCRDCGHMQLAQLPARAMLRSAYSEAESDDYVAEEAGHRASARRTLDRIERSSRRGRLLDVGCWVGFLLDEAHRRGWSATGVEPSSYASRYARDRLGLDVRTSELSDAELEPASFDAVVLCDVLEHIPDPGLTLDEIAAVCRPDGVLYQALPDAGSRVATLMGARWWSVIPTHVQYFTRRSLCTLLARHRWRVVEITSAPKAFTVGYYLGRLEGYSPPVARALVSGAERLRIAERIWAHDFRDRMGVLARPPAGLRLRS